MKSSVKPISKKIKTKRKLRFVLFSGIFISLIALTLLMLVTDVFKIKSIKISINGEVNNIPIDSRVELEEMLLGKNILFISENSIRNNLINKYKNIQNVYLDRHFDKTVEVRVKLYEVKYVGCVPDEGFLIACMYADINGVFFKESDIDLSSDNLSQQIKEKVKDQGLYYIDVSKSALSQITTGKDGKDIDSLVSTRLYDEAKMYKLLQYIRWVEGLNYLIDKIEAKELNVVKIKTNKSSFLVSLDKSYVDTLTEYESLESQDFFSKIEKEKLEQIDLSFKDKIFYKEKVDKASSSKIKIDLIATGTATSTGI
jgi:hypothetical protein